MTWRSDQAGTGIGGPVQVPARFSLRVLCVTLLSLHFAACTPTRLAREPSPVVQPSDAVRTIRARENRIRTMRARFTARTRHGTENHTADGVVVVRKPDAFRLRLMLWFGMTVLDYLLVGDRVHLVLPLRDGSWANGPLDDLLPFSGSALSQVFLRGPLAFPGTCRPEQATGTVVSIACRGEGGELLRRVEIDSHHGRIRQEQSYLDGHLSFVSRFSDFQTVGDADLPHRITLDRPAEDFRVDVEIERYEINLRLDDRLFQPVTP